MESVPRQTRLLPKILLVARLEEAYYEALNTDPRFCFELLDLREIVRPYLAAPWPYGAAAPLVGQCAERWRLPREHGVADLWESLFVSCWETEAPFLTIGPRSYMAPVAQAISAEAPEPIMYDPTLHGAKWLRAEAKRRAAEVERKLLAQGTALGEQLSSWGTIPPHHRDSAVLLRLGLRLYRRAVLELSWTEIAKQESAGTSEYCDWQTVRSTVVSWANQLDVRLPVRPSGRPRLEKPVS